VHTLSTIQSTSGSTIFCREVLRVKSHLLGDRLSCEMERWTEPLLNAVRNPRAVRITFRILAFYNSNTYSQSHPASFTTALQLIRFNDNGSAAIF